MFLTLNARPVLLLTACLFGAVDAKAQDTWSGEDKQMHFAGSALIGFSVKVIAKDRLNDWQAIGITMIPGVLKELSDSRPGGTGWSARDIIADLAGAYVGVKLGGLHIAPLRDGVTVRYFTEF